MIIGQSHISLCAGLQVLSYIKLQELDLEKAMDLQLKALETKDDKQGIKGMCMSGVQLQAWGIKVEEPLKNTIEKLNADSDLIVPREKKLRELMYLGKKVQKELQTRPKPDCSTLCPWTVAK